MCIFQFQRSMCKFNLLCKTLLLVIYGCLTGGHETLNVGGNDNNCNNSIIYDVYENWNYYIVWNGWNFQSPCNFVFQITNNSIPYDDEQRYSVCVEQMYIYKQDSNTGLTCAMYSPPYGSSEITEKAECYQIGYEEGKTDVCADIYEFMNVSFTTKYDFNSNTPDSFKTSNIKLKIYARWNMPLAIVLSIVFGSIGFCAFVIIGIVIKAVKKYRWQQEAQRAQMAQNNQGTDVQPNQPVNLQPGYYTTQFAQDKSAFQYNIPNQYGVQNSVFDSKMTTKP